MAEPAGAPHRTTGSTLLHPLSALLGIPLDQINFVACQLFALLAAFWFRIYLSPSHASSAVRHAFATLFGIYFAVFCFGWYSIHLFVLVMMNYGIMNMASIPNIHRYFPLILELGSSNKVTVAAKLSDPWSEVLDLVLDFELEKAEVPELSVLQVEAYGIIRALQQDTHLFPIKMP
ncbi:hypothetical protein WISP_78046 [Willisornis vidua]|uniref:Uncharacterized protein n=1 Tax=Willisornis vidua TaxID=1566151 RepID=A0ABQ9D636_9PASS|nr:hypothetical protein WISP_78046 [Willisornis vidua]